MNLDTIRCNCSLIRDEDFDDLLRMYQEEDSNKYIAPLLNKSDSFYREFLERKIEANKSVPSFWVVRLKKDQSFVGTINLNQFAQTDLTHLGCHLSRKFWQQGYASELMEVLMEFALKERKLNSVHGIFEKENIVSKKLLVKLGFRPYESRFNAGKSLLVYRYDV